MIDAELQAQDIDRLNAMFGIYAELNKRDLDLLLANRGNQIGFHLYEGYRGKRAPSKSYAVRELRKRTRAGEGTKSLSRPLRVQRLEEKWTSKIPRYFPLRGKSKKTGGRPLTRWQMLVGQEVIKRQIGRGFLAASFLWFRKRRDKQAPKGFRLVKNRTASVLGRVDFNSDSVRIRAFPNGLAVIDAKYGIVRGALQRSERDMVEYIQPRMTATAREAIQRAGLSASFA